MVTRKKKGPEGQLSLQLQLLTVQTDVFCEVQDEQGINFLVFDLESRLYFLIAMPT